jgi:hypothetical protein
LQHEDAQATSEAMNALTADADKLSDIQRQALSRALQRAANVGRGDPASSSALREAARAIGAGESADNTVSAADAALRQAMQASAAQTSLRAMSQRLRDLQTQLASGALEPSPHDPSQSEESSDQEAASPRGTQLAGGTPVALDSSGGFGLRDPSAERQSGAGVGGADLTGNGAPIGSSDAAENVFVPGREGTGPADQELTEQPFTVRGAPRPYRDVLGQYAQSSRDYVDRPDVSPAVRDLVKQYFQQLEEGQ